MLNPTSAYAQAGAVALGGALGSLLRWRISIWLGTASWPIAAGTLAVNLVGGLLMGFSLVVFERIPAEGWRLLLITGGLGGLTTFSAFSAESLSLVIQGDWALALVHTGVHVLGALTAAALGWQFGRWVLN